MRRAVFVGMCLLLAPLQGECLYCAYPTFSNTPQAKVDAPASDVHAFRVDTTTKGILPIGGFLHVPDDQLYRWDFTPSSQRLAKVDINSSEVPAQFQASVSFGLAIPILVANVLTHTSHSVSVRLYRPGFELVELKRGSSNRVVWKPARDLQTQEEALDKLLAAPLDPGSTSPAHRQALLFGASEYERLAALTPTTGTVETAMSRTPAPVLLTEKADALRRLADK